MLVITLCYNPKSFPSLSSPFSPDSLVQFFTFCHSLCLSHTHLPPEVSQTCQDDPTFLAFKLTFLLLYKIALPSPSPSSASFFFFRNTYHYMIMLYNQYLLSYSLPKMEAPWGPGLCLFTDEYVYAKWINKWYYQGAKSLCTLITCCCLLLWI